MANTYRRYGLTGGGSGSLDALDGTALASGDVAISVDSSNVAYVHSLNPSDGGAESSPTTIAPDTNAGTKRWKLSSLWATAFNALTLAAQAVGFTISGGTTSKTLTVEDNSLVNQDLTTDASPTFVTAKLSGLTDGYIPVHTSDAVGLANSTLKSTSGAITNTSQALLKAYQSTQINNATGDNTAYTIIFDTVIKNQNMSYNNATGVLTAGITGEYSVVSSVYLSGLAAGHIINAWIYTSNRLYPIIRAYTYTNESYLLEADVDLDAADTLYIVVVVSGGSKVVDIYGDSNCNTFLSCYLKC